MKKKALVVLLAIAMVFCFASAAMAADYSDMGNTTKATQDAVNRLSGLGVIDGYTDGTFGPNNNIRRDEMAKIATIAAGFASSADSMKNQSTGYTDARSGIWSTGYINIASAQGYMKGVGNNKFNPAANITNAEVLTTVLRMYGYNDNLTGPWPINYVNQAVKDGITDDVANFSSGSTATRGDVAIMVSAALDQTMVEYSKDTESFQEKQYAASESSTGSGFYTKTLFVAAFGGEQIEKVMINGLAVDAYDAEEGVTYSFYLDYDKDGTKDEGEPTLEADEDTVVNGADFWALNNKYATIAYDKELNAKVITVTSTSVDFTELELTGTSKVKANGTTYYLQDGYVIADFTGVADAKLEATGDKIKAADMNDKGTISLDYEGKVYGISVDRDNAVGTIEIVTDINVDRERIGVNGATAGTAKWTTLEKVVIVKDGEIVTPAALEAGDILKYKAAGAVAVVSDVDVTGTVGKNKGTTKWDKVAIGDVEVAQGATMDFVEVDGDKYDFDNDVAVATSKLVAATDGLYDKEVSIVKGGDNAIAMVIYDAGETSSFYGVLTDSKTTTGDWTTAGGQYTSITIFGEDGTAVEYTVNADKRADVADDLAAIATALDSDTIETGLGNPVKYTLNKDGELIALTAVEKVTADADGYDISNSKYITIDSKKYAFTDDAVVYNMTEDDDKLVVEKVDLATVLAKDKLTYDAITVGPAGDQNTYDGVYVFKDKDNAGNLIECLIVTDMQGSSDSKYAIVDSKFAYEGDSYITFVGDSTEYKVDMDKLETAYNNVKSGNVVKYAIVGGKVDTLDAQATGNKDNFSQIAEVSGSLVYIGANSYELASDVNVYVYDSASDKYVIGDLGDVIDGYYVLTAMMTPNADGVVTDVIVIDDVSYGELSD